MMAATNVSVCARTRPSVAAAQSVARHTPRPSARAAPASRPMRGARRSHMARAEPEGADGAGPSGKPAQAEDEVPFGYKNKDPYILGFGLIGLGYGMYYGLQAMGMEPGYAGNWVQAIIFLGICVGWISSYLYRVATKQMTYVKQLEQYEQAVIAKRLEEMTDAEMETLMKEVEEEKQRKQERSSR